MPPLSDERRARLRALLQTDATFTEIAKQMNCSAPNIVQLVNRHSDLRRLRPPRKTSALARLKAYRQELLLIEDEAKVLKRRIRIEIRALEEEILIGEVDHA